MTKTQLKAKIDRLIEASAHNVMAGGTDALVREIGALRASVLGQIDLMYQGAGPDESFSPDFCPHCDGPMFPSDGLLHKHGLCVNRENDESRDIIDLIEARHG